MINLNRLYKEVSNTFTGFLSAMLLGSTLSYLDLEMKTVEEIEEEGINVYAYYAELNTIYNQNDAELRYFENQDVGTFESPLPGNNQSYHLFSYVPEEYDNSDEYYVLLSFYINNMFPAEESLEMIEHLEGYDEAAEGYEWRVFEISYRHYNSTDPNVGVWINQDDFNVYVDEDTPIEHDEIVFEEWFTNVQIYELERFETMYAKQIPIDAPFYFVYQHEDSEDSYVTYVEDTSIIERDQ